MTREPGAPGVSAGPALWWAPLDVSAPVLRSLVADLSAEERGRADRLARPLDRRRFLAARGWLRRLLAGELGCPPDQISIVAEGGKPRLARPDVFFNTARSAGLAVYATSRAVEVGVDIELIAVGADLDGVAARCFSAAERRALDAVPPARRRSAQYQCWTFKEAYAKGIGTGLSFPLDSIDVWVGPGQRSTVSGWTVDPVDLAPEYAVAVAGAAVNAWPPPVPRRLAEPIRWPDPG